MLRPAPTAFSIISKDDEDIDSMKSRVRARANIALIKYWGKANEVLNTPAVGSLSITLDKLWSDTEVVFDVFGKDRHDISIDEVEDVDDDQDCEDIVCIGASEARPLVTGLGRAHAGLCCWNCFVVFVRG